MYFKQCILIYETIIAVAKDLIELKSIGMFWNWNSGILQLPKNKDKTMDDFKTAQFNTAHNFSRKKNFFAHKWRRMGWVFLLAHFQDNWMNSAHSLANALKDL